MREGAWATSPSADSARYPNRGRTMPASNCKVTRSRNTDDSDADAAVPFGAAHTGRQRRAAGNLQRRQQCVRIDDHVHGVGAVSNNGRRLRLADFVRARRSGAPDQDRHTDAGKQAPATTTRNIRSSFVAFELRRTRSPAPDIRSALSYVAPLTADWKPVRPGRNLFLRTAGWCRRKDEMYADKRSIHTGGSPRGRSRDTHRRIEPSGSATHQRGPARGQYGRLRVREPGPTRHGDADRQLDPARRASRRTQLLQIRRRRQIRDQHRQQRQRRRQHRLRVPVQDRGPESGHVPVQHGPGHLTRRSELQHQADLHGGTDAARHAHGAWQRTDDPASEDRSPLGARLRGAGCGRRPHLVGRLQSVRRAAR